MPRTAILILALLLVVLPPLAGFCAAPLGRPGPGDLVVFIAREKPALYRLVGRRALPFGDARLEQPIALIADQKAGCFYLLDNPTYVAGECRVLRITPDGRSSLVYRAKGRGGYFGHICSFCVGPEGRLYLVSQTAGIYQITPGNARQFFTGQYQELAEMTAAVVLPQGRMLVATSYADTVDPGTDSTLPRHQRKPGHIFDLNLRNTQAPPRVAVANRQPGGGPYDTYWRSIRQMLPDAAGRIVMADFGSKTPASEVYTGYQYRYQAMTPAPPGGPTLKNPASVIHGGVLVLHPDGRVQDLTYQNPQRAAGPLRHPRGIAQWDRDTYIVADPEMYVKGLGQCGGLMLLGLDGSRHPRWFFGQGIRPCGVAILRGVGAGAGPAAKAEAEPGPLAMHHLTAIRSGGAITQVTSLRVSRARGQGSGSMGGLVPAWDDLPSAQAAARLRQVCQGALWQVRGDGTAAWAAPGQALGQASPFSLAGTSRISQNLGLIVLKNRSKSMFDTRLGSLKARLTRGRDGVVTAEIELTVMDKAERIQAVFTQVLTN